MLCPGGARVETSLGVFQPEELTLSGLGIGACSDEILAAITIEIDPEAHVIEIACLLLGNLDSLNSPGQVSSVHTDDVDSTVLLAWYKETVGNDNGTLAEDVLGHGLDVVGPFELGSVELYGLQI